MQLSQVIPALIFNEAIKAVFPPDPTDTSEDPQTPDWIAHPIIRWYELHQFETAINDDATIMGYKLIALLMRYRDRINVKYKQYQLLIKTLENPSLTTKTTSDNTLSNTASSTATNTSNSTSNNKYVEGLGGGDATNQTGSFRNTTDNTTTTENGTSKNTAESNETNNLVSTSTTTDAYMSLEGLKHEISTIFSALMEDLSLTLLINIW